MINDKAVAIIEKLFELFKKRYQNNLESMNGSDFVFDYVHLLYYKCHTVNPNCGGSYIDCPDWIKNKKSNNKSHQNKDKKCFQYTVTVALNHEEVKKDPQRITKIKFYKYI